MDVKYRSRQRDNYRYDVARLSFSLFNYLPVGQDCYNLCIISGVKCKCQVDSITRSPQSCTAPLSQQIFSFLYSSSLDISCCHRLAKKHFLPSYYHLQPTIHFTLKQFSATIRPLSSPLLLPYVHSTTSSSRVKIGRIPSTSSLKSLSVGLILHSNLFVPTEEPCRLICHITTLPWLKQTSPISLTPQQHTWESRTSAVRTCRCPPTTYIISEDAFDKNCSSEIPGTDMCSRQISTHLAKRWKRSHPLKLPWSLFPRSLDGDVLPRTQLLHLNQRCPRRWPSRAL